MAEPLLAFADGTRQFSASPNSYWATSGQQVRDNILPNQPNVTNISMPASGIMSSWPIPLYEGDVISRVLAKTGSSGATTPTNWWFALYDADRNLLTQTADQLTAVIGGLSTLNLPFLVPQTIRRNGIYYAAWMLAAAGVSNFTGVTMANDLPFSGGLLPGQIPKSMRSGAGLTGTAPASIASPTFGTGIPYIALF